MSNKEITTWKIPQEYIDQQQKIQTQDKLIEELEAIITKEIHFTITDGCPECSTIWSNNYEIKDLKLALAKIKKHREKNK